MGWNPQGLNLILPIGISFYTFQTLSYTIDVYRGRLEATDDLLDFALFVGFFPQLVAGPIVRASHLLPQFREGAGADPRASARGLPAVRLRLLQEGLHRRSCRGLRRRSLRRRGRLRCSHHLARGSQLTRCRSTLTSQAIRTWPSAPRACWATTSTRTSAIPIAPRASPTSGGAGTSRSRPGCATICTSRSAAVAAGRRGPTSI